MKQDEQHVFHTCLKFERRRPHMIPDSWICLFKRKSSRPCHNGLPYKPGIKHDGKRSYRKRINSMVWTDNQEPKGWDLGSLMHHRSKKQQSYTETTILILPFKQTVRLLRTSVVGELDVFKLAVHHCCDLELRSRMTDLGVSSRHLESFLLSITRAIRYKRIQRAKRVPYCNTHSMVTGH